MSKPDPLIQFRVTPEEYEKIQKLADKDDRKISPWAKRVFLKEFNKMKGA